MAVLQLRGQVRHLLAQGHKFEQHRASKRPVRPEESLGLRPRPQRHQLFGGGDHFP